MENLLRVALFGLVSGITGTGLGGLIAILTGNIGNRFLSFILEFSAGLMTAVVCFKLLPEAFELGGIAYSLTGLLLGVLAIIIIEEIINKSVHMLKRYGSSSLLRTGILMAVGIALHNFPEGLAVGSGFEASFSLGFTITAVIIIHDIPEGIAMAMPMRRGGFSRVKALSYTILSGVPMGLGAAIGAALGRISSHIISLCLGFAAGAMLYIVYAELVPESKKIYLGRLSSVGNVLGLLCGIIVSICN
ncbi:MAG: ZIP family metal transporter [Acetivibrionales bacterium]|jgi:ZIP family zinc transporter